MSRLYIFFAAALMLLPAPALAQEQADPQEGMICLTIGRRWQGSAEETRRIESDPVPASFTSIQQSGTCAAFQLLSFSLIDWHMNFGTETSIRPALRHYAGGRFDVPDGPDWETLWRRAAPALKRAEAAAADKADLIAAARVMSADKAGMALLTRIRTWQSRIEAAHHYLRAADLWQSRTLLADARPVVAWVEESALFLKSKGLLEKEGDRKPLANILRVTSHDEEDRFGLQAHMLALQADLGSTAEQSTRAREAVAALETPVLKGLMDEGWRHGDNLCDMGERSDLVDLSEACRDENDIERTLLAYAWLTVRTRSDNAPQEGRDSLYDAEILLRRAHESHGGPDLTALADRRSPTEPMFILLMDQARRLMKAAADPAVQTGRETWDATSYRQAAGESLSAALQSLNPAQAPTPWRIAAQLWLSNHQAMADSPEGVETAKLDDRMAAYLRAVLTHLESGR